MPRFDEIGEYWLTRHELAFVRHQVSIRQARMWGRLANERCRRSQLSAVRWLDQYRNGLTLRHDWDTIDRNELARELTKLQADME